MTIDIMTLRTKSYEGLNEILAEQRERLADLRFQLSIRELKNVHEIRATRRTIARILTILNSRQPTVPMLRSGSRHEVVGTDNQKQSERVAA